MLNLVGTGISQKGIAVDALEACKSCTKIYLDRYTSTVSADKADFLKKELGKPIKELSRSDMEENIGRLVKEAKENDIAILVGGDPLIATTHKIMLIKAKEQGVKVRVFHSSSIVSAMIGESGLDFYRFGSVITIPKWSEHYKPTSFYQTITNNNGLKLHSILLLDYDSKAEASISIGEAVRTLEAAEKEHKRGIIKPDKRIIIMVNISQKNERKHYLSIKEAEKLSNEGSQAAIIIPAEITEIEKEMMDTIYDD